jgi:ribosomal protein L11 methylase PrmA
VKYDAPSTISGQGWCSAHAVNAGDRRWRLGRTVERFYRPFKLARLVIRPPWEPYTAAADELLLTLNPGKPSALVSMRRRNCARLLRAIIDMRPGGGFLTSVVAADPSLAGVLFGCGRAYGIDVDRLAVWVARVNARLNQLSKQASLRPAPGSGHGPV